MHSTELHQYVSLTIDGVLFGISVDHIEDVIFTPNMTYVPLAEPMICGLLNLRGRIVTALDFGMVLNVSAIANAKRAMSIIVEIEGSLYSLLVDSVGEVMTLTPSLLEKNPSNVEEQWRQYSLGVFYFGEKLLIVLDEKKIFSNLFVN